MVLSSKKIDTQTKNQGFGEEAAQKPSNFDKYNHSFTGVTANKDRLPAVNKLSLDIVWWFYKPNSALYNQLPFCKLFSKFTVVVNILLSLYKQLAVYKVENISDLLHSHGWLSQAQSHM